MQIKQKLKKQITDLTGRMVCIETNKESPAELPVKDQQSLKQEYDL